MLKALFKTSLPALTMGILNKSCLHSKKNHF